MKLLILILPVLPILLGSCGSDSSNSSPAPTNSSAALQAEWTQISGTLDCQPGPVACPSFKEFQIQSDGKTTVDGNASPSLTDAQLQQIHAQANALASQPEAACTPASADSNAALSQILSASLVLKDKSGVDHHILDQNNLGQLCFRADATDVARFQTLILDLLKTQLATQPTPTPITSPSPEICTQIYVYGVVVTLKSPEGQPVTGAQVTITEGSYQETLKESLPSEPAGVYSGAGERAGNYSVSITAPGFKPYQAIQWVVTAGVCHVTPVMQTITLQRL